MAESYGCAETVSTVVCRYGFAATQLFTWRREARAATPEPPLTVAPVRLVEPAPEPVETPRGRGFRSKSKRGNAGGIELEIDGVAIRVERGAEPVEQGCVHLGVAEHAGPLAAPPFGSPKARLVVMITDVRS